MDMLYEINPVVFSCARKSSSSAKTILRNGDKLVKKLCKRVLGQGIFCVVFLDSDKRRDTDRNHKMGKEGNSEISDL